MENCPLINPDNSAMSPCAWKKACVCHTERTVERGGGKQRKMGKEGSQEGEGGGRGKREGKEKRGRDRQTFYLDEELYLDRKREGGGRNRPIDIYLEGGTDRHFIYT